MAAAYAQMVSKFAGLTHPPTLEFYNDLHDVGGLFMPDTWSIAIGQADMERIADRMIAERGSDIAQIVRELSPRQRVSAASIRLTVLGAATARCIAHELGHAVIHLGFQNPYAPDDEAGADYYAARIDAARSRDWRLGEIFFRTIGCTGPSCTHPSPDGRSQAYVHGYNEQVAATANAR